MKQGNIPFLSIQGRTIPEVWEKAVLLTWGKGVPVRTEYDKTSDPPSRDCTMAMIVEEPMSEPRIHRAFPGGLEDLEIYRQEVVSGIHDHWINPKEGKWTYTYHQRLFNYEIDNKKIDQIALLIDRLSKKGFTRRAQAITWNPAKDADTEDPPCLQRIFCRLIPNELGKHVLNMNLHWRSRDAYKAAFMNMFALTDLQKVIAGKIAEKTGQQVLVGRYIDISDSFHIYGSYFQEFQGFIDNIQKRSFEERTWATEFAEPFFEIGRQKIKDEK